MAVLPHFVRTRSRVLIFWLMAAVAVPVWTSFDSSAWDLRVYGTAMTSLQSGHDPYVDATAIQKQHHARVMANGGVDTDNTPPYSYVYSPITLPLLRAFGHLPRIELICLYWLIYIAGICLAIAVGVSLGTGEERTPLLYMAGVAPFFPGLLANGTVLSGNIAYILYGMALLAAWLGWRRFTWWPFYLVVLAASCIKAPFLSLALIPALSARKQWLPSLATMAVGVALFASQIVLWPTLFRHYLEAIELQFSFNHDFGSSPAGLFSGFLYAHGLPYSPASSILYAAYATPTVCILFYLSRRYLNGCFSLTQWAPVLLLGIILLNPRIMEYDVAPVTILMALVGWRWIRVWTASRKPLVVFATLFIVANAASLYSWQWRKAIDGPLLTTLFCGGCCYLLRSLRSVSPKTNTPLQEVDVEQESLTVSA